MTIGDAIALCGLSTLCGFAMWLMIAKGKR